MKIKKSVPGQDHYTMPSQVIASDSLASVKQGAITQGTYK